MTVFLAAALAALAFAAPAHKKVKAKPPPKPAAQAAAPAAKARVPDTVFAHAGTLFRLRFGQTAVLEPMKLKVRFDDVVEDKRCPPTVYCMLEGVARVALWIEKDNHPVGRYVWAVAMGESSAKDFPDFRITIERVDPFPERIGGMRKSSYSINLTVARL